MESQPQNPEFRNNPQKFTHAIEAYNSYVKKRSFYNMIHFLLTSNIALKGSALYLMTN